MSFNPYIFFSGDCAEAFALYSSVFGVQAEVMRHGDLPPGVEPMEGARPEHVMHASIQIGDSYLMGSDDPTGDGGPKLGISVSYSAPDIANAQAVFAALSEGGRVDMPLEPTFWSPMFGAVVDRFGVSWMIDTVPAEVATSTG